MSTSPYSNTPISYISSIVIAVYILAFLYFPSSLFLQFVSSSPVVISTIILCLNLVRLGASQNQYYPTSPIDNDDDSSTDHVSNYVYDDDSGANNSEVCRRNNSFYAESFVEWDVRAPLGVIYEEYDEEGQDDINPSSIFDEAKKREADMNIIKRYASLSLFYPETDSDDGSSTEDDNYPADGKWDLPEDMCFRWHEEDDDDREGNLIEIPLDDDDGDQKKMIIHTSCSDDEVVDEDNLIEIDLSPAR